MLTRLLRICEASDMQSTHATAVTAIRMLLASRGKSQAWLAGQLGETPFWLSRRMSGKKTFDVGTLDRIAAVFDLTTEEMLRLSLAVAS